LTVVTPEESVLSYLNFDAANEESRVTWIIDSSSFLWTKGWWFCWKFVHRLVLFYQVEMKKSKRHLKQNNV